MSEAVQIAAFPMDPPALELWSSFDPETFIATAAIYDALVYIDTAGEVRPALATAWRAVDPLTWEIELRRGVRFHDGTPFDADSVAASLDAHLAPVRTLAGASLFALVDRVEVCDPHRVRVYNKAPDAIFPRRLFSSHIAPAHQFARGGIPAVAAEPIGTGPYRLLGWERGRAIRLARNDDHWSGADRPARVDLRVLPRREWVDRLRDGYLDAAIDLDANEAAQLRDVPHLHVAHGPAAITHWFLFRPAGPLADVRVRRALNHAVHRELLTTVVEHGNGAPQRGVIPSEDPDFPEGVASYAYDPERAAQLLAEAGLADGFTLRGLVSESSAGIFAMIREFLSRVGVRLEASLLPRAMFFQRVEQVRGEIDFSIASIDNPIHHPLFAHLINLSTFGGATLLRDPEYDRRFFGVGATLEPTAHRAAFDELERYVADRALLLHTTSRHVYYAARRGLTLALPRSGHFDAELYLSAQIAPGGMAGPRPGPLLERPTPAPDLAQLVAGTSPQGLFYLDDARFGDPTAERVWRNVLAGQDRWHRESEPMIRELVQQVEARTHLSSVLRATERVGIAGWATSGRVLFVNTGFQRWFPSVRSPDELLGAPRWAELCAAVAQGGAWVGRVQPASRAADAPAELVLTLTVSRDSYGAAVGWSFVLADFSGEEERVRTGAIRTILDRVPYGLFLCDPQGLVLSGYSRSCDGLLSAVGRDLAGQPLSALLELPPREAGLFDMAYGQIFDDLLPEEVTLGQLPTRIHRARDGRHLRLEGAVVRDDDGVPQRVLFTLLDITAQVEAEQETERIRGVLHVLQHRAAFDRLLRGIHEQTGLLLTAQRGPYGEPWQTWARRELHTWKGGLAMFALSGISAFIHEIEEQEELTVADVCAVAERLDAALEANRGLWGLSRAGGMLDATVPLARIDALVRAALSANTLECVRAEVLRFRDTLDARHVHELAGPLAEAVRLQARRTGKQAELAIIGGDLYVPPQLAAFFDVLPHLLRNAVDHGIEQERGDKPARGRITLAASEEDGALRLQISDDGRGIDERRLVERAVALGRLPAAEAAALSLARRLALVFEPGLSTAEQVTETSGRGVGLDAVAAAVRALGGEVAVESAPGQGTTFTVSLPLPAAPGVGLASK